MTGKDPDDERGKRIDDEEGEVDSRFKTRIIQNRIRVDEAEEKLFVDAPTDPGINISRENSISVWSTMVKQYLRTIEPVLSSDEVDDAPYYYEEIPIGSVELHPPDKDGYRFSMIPYSDESDKKIRRALGLPRGATLPEIEEIPFHGLRSIIEAPEVLSHRWVVTVDESGLDNEQLVLEQSRVPDKKLYVDAVRHADKFLQDAGLGIDIAEEGVPEFGFVEVGSDGA